MELLVYYISFCIVVGLSLFAASKRHSSRRHWEITPEVTVIISFFLYTSAMPLSRFLWGTEGKDLDVGFMQSHLLGGVGLLVGLIGGKLLSPPKALQTLQTMSRPMPPARCAILAACSTLIVLGYIYYSVGFSLANVFRPYAFERTIITTGTTLDTLIEPAAIAMLLYCYLSADSFRTQKPQLRRFVLGAVTVVAIIFLIRGMRNPVQILCLPVFAIAFRNRRIPVFKTAVAMVSVFILFSVVAVVRNYGLLAADTAPLTTTTLDPLHGELGTSYNVFTIFKSIAYSDDLQYGKTYTVDLGLNLVPHALWPNRPPSTAIRFSMRYFGTENLNEGLGFSPVVEALSNFSEGGIPVVFALFAFAVVAVGNYLRVRGRWGLLSYAMMMPMIINWNRIDSNASFKMFAVYVGFFIVFDKMLQIRISD